jgi:heterodisulfide reductase subunit B
MGPGKPKVLVYPGCMVLARFQGYEFASRLVLEKLGYEIASIGEFCCCGATLLPGVTGNWVNLSAYSLALAEQAGADIVTLCGNCSNNFKRANQYLEKHPEVRHNTTRALAKLGLAYSGKTKIYHLLEILHDRLPDIEKLVAKTAQLKVALTHPCQVYRPTEITGTQDDPDAPKSMRLIVKSLGFEVVAYRGEYDCCGATALLFDEELAISQGRSRLKSAKASNADLICAACGNCLFLLGRYQNILLQDDPDFRMSVMSIGQLAALAFGYSKESLHIGSEEALDLD